MAVNKRLIGAGATGSSALVPSDNFKVIKYTGTGASRSVSVGFQPDFVWIKHIGGTGSHSWTDSSRGNNLVLQSNETSTEASGQITLDSDGFTIGNDNALRNTNGEEYVAWCWKANGGTTSSNSDGSITSTVQANADLGFSIVLYQGTQSSATVGHGLGIAPKLVITKSRGTAQGWPTLIVGSDGTVYGGTRLNESNANSSGNGTGFFQNAAPTTSVFSLGASDESNPNGTNTIAYCFADVDGYQKIGSYTGTGSASDRPIIETGFEPAFVMIKNVSSTGSWMIHDNARNTTNPRDKYLRADANNAEGSAAEFGLDFLSNGFQIGPTTNYHWNTSGNTYIYLAVAADPDTEAPTLASSFNAELYTGNATNNNVNIGFDSGLTWIKNRTDAGSYHILFDVVRGLNQVIHSGRDQAQQGSSNNFSYENGVLSFDGSTTWGNKLASDYVAWNWKANDNEPTILPNTELSSLISKYKFEDNANDSYGNNNGTASNLSYVSGKFGNAADFNGTSSKILYPQAAPFNDSNTILAISVWVKLDAASDEFVVMSASSTSDQSDYGLLIVGGNRPGRVFLSDAPSNANEYQATFGSSNNTNWNHYVWQLSASGGIELWYNGTKQTRTTLVSSGSMDETKWFGDLTYATSVQWATGINRVVTTAYSDGSIDQMRLFNAELTSSEISDLYNEGLEALVSANANAGFSIVKFDGGGSVNNVPHGLSAAPEMILYKRLDSAGDWQVYHISIGNGNKLTLNSSAASSSTSRFNSTSPTATNFTFNSSSYTGNIIAYCFHSVTGYSKFGSYAGNGSTNAITTGFKPDFVFIKVYDNTDQWVIIDSRRGGTKILQPNLNAAESTESGVNVSFTSTGFTHTGSGGGIGQVNSSGSNYIYWAVAKNVPSNTTLADSFNVTRYSGNGGTKSITGLGFRPDFLWIKNRTSSAQGHIIQDTLRAAGSTKVLFTSESSAEGTYGQYGHTSTFDSDGFTVVNGSGEHTNTSAENYVAWCWKAGNNWESNLDGSIPSVVNANTANGFSIIKYTGTSASSQSVGHGLNSTPELVMIKNLDASEGWIVWATGFGTSNWLELNSTAAYNQDNAGWGGTHSSTVVNLQDGGAARSSANGVDYIAYCWHSVSGYSKIGTYTGSGSDGNAVTTGFQPDFVMIKRLNSTGGWLIFDSARSGTSPINDRLEADNGSAEQTGSSTKFLDFNSNNFEANGSDSEVNASGSTYLYMAFKQNATLSTEKAKSFNVTTYTGNGSTNSITGVGFRPDFVWLKDRDSTNWHTLFDNVRGPAARIHSNSSNAQDMTGTTSLTSFDSDGFSLGSNANENTNTNDYVAWSWKAGNNWVNNNDGSVSSIVNYNTGNKFSIVRYTGTGSATTVGHGLGTTPTFIIGKTLDSSAKWRVYHSGLGGAANYLNLNDTFAKGTSSNVWNSTTPTSSVFSVGSDLSPNGEEMIAYVWADCDGLSKFGTYTGNGSSSGTVVEPGFSPDFIIVRRHDGTSDWGMFDSSRSGSYYQKGLKANTNDSEFAETNINSFCEFLAVGHGDAANGGFRFRDSGSQYNVSSASYIYIAFKIN